MIPDDVTFRKRGILVPTSTEYNISMSFPLMYDFSVKQVALALRFREKNPV